MNDQFIVPEKTGGEPLGGSASDSKRRSLYDKPAKKVGWIMLAILLVISVCYYRLTSNENGNTNNSRISSPTHSGTTTLILTTTPSKAFEVRDDQDWYFRVKSGWANEIRVIDLDNPAARHSIGPGKHFITSGIKRFQLVAVGTNPSSGPVVMELWTK